MVFIYGSNEVHKMKIPEPTNTIANLIDQAHEKRKELPRGHLGASMLGDPCDRKLWLSFRWAVQEQFTGRILRLFRRGHNEESIIVSDLRAIGIDIRSTTGKQSRVDFGSHVSGSLDGIIEGGVPEAPKTRHVAEFKTHSKKSFDDVGKNGVQKSKPLHYVQMQVYMHGTRINRALYLAVCKDDDRIYTERVEYVPEVATKAIERAHRITLSDRMPEPLSTRADWFECKFCAAHEFCHKTQTTEHVNCRTCAHATPLSDSTWHCAKWDDVIPVEAQHNGCESHVLHPDLVRWKRLDGPDQWTAIYEIEGQKVANGAPAEGVYGSAELLANASACAGGDEQLNALRLQFDGRIVG
jgi:hypothetical protein